MRYLIILLLLFTSCATKKTLTKEIYKRDSIFIIKDRYITKKINDTITINSICDTLGELKSFDRVIATNNVKVSIKSEKGGIKAIVNIDSLVNSKVQEFKQNYKTEVKEVKVVRYKIPFWVWIALAFETLLIFVLLRK